MLNENKINKQFKLLFEDENKERNNTITKIKQMILSDNVSKDVAFQLMKSQQINWNELNLTEEEFDSLISYYEGTDSVHSHDVGSKVFFDIYSEQFETLKGNNFEVRKNLVEEAYGGWVEDVEKYEITHPDSEFHESYTYYKDVIQFLSEN